MSTVCGSKTEYKTRLQALRAGLRQGVGLCPITVLISATLASSASLAADPLASTSKGSPASHLSAPGKVASSGQFTILHTFSCGSDGATPQGGLSLGTDGKIYGTTAYGGDSNAGVLFRIDEDDSFHIVTQLAYSIYEPLNPGIPTAAPTMGADGLLYGITVGGGTEQQGTVYAVPTGTNQLGADIIHSFGSSSNDGYSPYGKLVQTPDGRLHGTTPWGGSFDRGILFSVNPNGSGYHIDHHFGSSASDGQTPMYALTLAADGSLYGSTTEGGTNGAGVLFKLDTSGHFSIINQLTQNAAWPSTSLVITSDGSMFGGSFKGANSDIDGTIFKRSPDGSIQVLHGFNWKVDGAGPAALVRLPDGYFYGTTVGGGTGSTDAGTIFRMSEDGQLAVAFVFDGVTASTPQGELAVGTNGAIYGATIYTNPSIPESNCGTVFKYVPAAVPGVPTDVVATPGDASVTLSWTAALDADSYAVYQGTSAGAESAEPVLSGIQGTTATVSGLTNGTPYFFTVVAVNEAGSSAASSEVSAVPNVAPGPITTLTANPGNARVALSWSASEHASAYTVYSGTSANALSVLAHVSGTSYTATSLSNGTAYWFQVVPTNSIGSGPASDTVSATPVIGTVSTPSFSVAAGHYADAQTVTISVATSGAVIYYTTDGSTPTASSRTYSAPIAVNASLTLKAMATAPEYADSAVATAQYTIGDEGGSGGGGAMGPFLLQLLAALALIRVGQRRKSSPN